jgi:inosine-uridine nucleoside N-ribohydrolase
MSTSPIPTIIDTDIGGDIDDTWALALALKRRELDLRLITTCTGDTEYRAKIVCRLLELAGRSDIPVGLGERYPSDGPREKQKPWVADYTLRQYAGKVHDDGIEALIRTCMDTPGITLIGIGPLTNIEAALRREPRIAERTKLVLMAGCIHKHYRNWLPPGPFPEFNVVQDLPAARVALAAPWRELVITPLDTCERVVLSGSHYQRCLASRDTLLQAVIANYRLWRNQPAGGEDASSVLYDAVAVWLAFSERHLQLEEHGLGLTQDGKTVLYPAKPRARLALEWTDFEAWIEEFTSTMEAHTSRASNPGAQSSRATVAPQAERHR